MSLTENVQLPHFLAQAGFSEVILHGGLEPRYRVVRHLGVRDGRPPRDLPAMVPQFGQGVVMDRSKRVESVDFLNAKEARAYMERVKAEEP